MLSNDMEASNLNDEARAKSTNFALAEHRDEIEYFISHRDTKVRTVAVQNMTVPIKNLYGLVNSEEQEQVRDLANKTISLREDNYLTLWHQIYTLEETFVARNHILSSDYDMFDDQLLLTCLLEANNVEFDIIALQYNERSDLSPYDEIFNKLRKGSYNADERRLVIDTLFTKRLHIDPSYFIVNRDAFTQDERERFLKEYKMVLRARYHAIPASLAMQIAGDKFWMQSFRLMDMSSKYGNFPNDYKIELAKLFYVDS